MARMGGKKHITRHAAPAFWPILRKEYKWTVKPSPGPHPIGRCIPLLIIVRDILGYAKTAAEARKLIAEGHFKVDGRVRKDYKFPVGLMDVFEVATTNEYYRLIPYPVKYMILHLIPSEEKEYKLVRIENKTTVKGGHIQLNLHDGRNLLIKVSDPTNPEEDVYKTLDTLLIKVPSQEIVEHLKLEKGALAIVISGRNVGRVGRIKSIAQRFKRRDSIVTLEDKNGEVFQTSLDNVFVIGKDKSVISLPEGAW